MKEPAFYVSMSPHAHRGFTLQRMNLEILIALLPAIFAGWFFFGIDALRVVVTSAFGAVLAELVWQKLLKRPVTVSDSSALVTGVTLGLLLSPSVPCWVVLLGSILAIIVGKQLFGGTGCNPFNAALVGWAMIQVSYTGIMESYPMPHPMGLIAAGEYTEYPLVDLFKLDGWQYVKTLLGYLPTRDLLVGNVPGSVGTTSVLAVLLGGIYLLARRIITWEIPVCFLASAWVFAFIFNTVDPAVYPGPNFMILAGWTMMAAFFLMPDKGTSPVTVPGMIVYGICGGMLAMTMRLWGTYMEGISFAILLMNSLTPLLDRIRPSVIGRVKEVA